MPPANNIGFSATSDMVSTTVSVQTSCPSSPNHSNFYSDAEDDEDICPKHFTDIHRCKLEDTFSRKLKPDDIQLQIIAMECNLLYKDVSDWFRKRRLKWMEDLVRNETTLYSANSRSSKESHQPRLRKNDTSPTLSDSNNNLPEVGSGKKKNHHHQHQNTNKNHNTIELLKNTNKNLITNKGISNHDVTST